MSGMPLFPLEVVLFPGGELPLHIFEPRYRKLVGRCMSQPCSFGLVRIHEDRLAPIGCEAVIVRQVRRYPDGRFDIQVRGVERVRLGKVREHEDGYLEAEVSTIQEGPEEADHALEDRIEEQYRQYASLASDVAAEPPPRGPRWSFRLADRMRLKTDVRQDLLEMESENGRLAKLLSILSQLIPALKKQGQTQLLVRGNGRLRSRTGEGPA